MPDNYFSESAVQYRIKSYQDYLKLPEGERWEIIDGQAYAMVAAPSRRHQQIVLELASTIHSYLKQKGNCQVYVAPFDVRLIDAGETEQNCCNVVQPDISVICDCTKLDDKGCLGAPDWIIEVVSPSHASHDYVRKLNLYERFGVREYWIVNPDSRHILVYRLGEQGGYGAPIMIREGEIAQPGLFPELNIDSRELFAE
ncbi:MAG: Uma2 family endonuclease [Bacillota bacterium]